jgi:uncharacterized protein (TIGR00297 family)
MPAVAIAGLLSAAAWRLGWLTRGGALAAWAVGGAILGFGGVPWAAPLAAFFITGTMLTRIGTDRKTQPEHAGRGRNAAQVLCTGGIGAALAAIWGLGLAPEAIMGALYTAYLGSVAAATADTWATEIGMLGARPPRMITTGLRVQPGTSGGISLLGTSAGAAGALFIAVVGSDGHRGGTLVVIAAAPLASALAQSLMVTAAGVVAMIVDSLLGATLQAGYRRRDGSPSENAGDGAMKIRGLPWMTNEVVNLAATATGALVAGLLAVLC